MKTYFTKYIPVDGEVQVGDRVLCPDYSINKVIGFDTDIGKFFTWISGAKCFIDGDDYKKLQFFLCSRDIEVGDDNIKLIVDGDMIFNSASKAFVFNNKLCVYIGHNDLTPVQLKKGLDFKIIGEISSKAKWVKEGDIFFEDEIKLQKLYTSKIDQGYLSKGEETFAFDDDSEEDTVWLHITMHGGEGGSEIVKRSDVNCRTKATIKCSQCETFH